MKNHKAKCAIACLLFVLAGLLITKNPCNLARNATNPINLVAKLSPRAASGEMVNAWITTWGGPSFDYGYATAVDGSGNVYLAGETHTSGPNGYDAFLARYTPNGTLVWNVTWGGTGFEAANGVAMDAYGMIYIVGSTDSFGAGSTDAFVAKYAPDGTKIWNQTWGGIQYDVANAVAIDASGNVYVGGSEQSFGIGTPTYYNAFIVKYASNGTQVWNQTWDGSNDDEASGIAVANNVVYLAGYTDSFGVGTPAEGNAFLAAYTLDGTSTKNITWGGSDYDSASGVAFSASSNSVVLAGTTKSFGTPGIENAFLASYSYPGLVSQWNYTWNYADTEDGNGVAVDNAGNVYLVGYLDGATTGEDVFVLRCNAGGSYVSSYNWTSPDGGNDEGNGVAVDATGAIYVSGTTNGLSASLDAFLMRLAPWGITRPPDFAYVAGTTGHAITWNITDTTMGASPLYSIINDLGPVATNLAWAAGTPITVNVDGLAPGTYTYTISATNGIAGPSGDSFTDSVVVSVARAAAPYPKAWNQTWGYPNFVTVEGIALGSNAAYIVGYNSYNPTRNADLTRVGLDGTRNWNVSCDGAATDEGHAVAVDPLGMIYIAGETKPAASYDSLLVKFAPDGTQMWKATWGTPSSDETANAVAIDNNSIYVAGTTFSASAHPPDAFLLKYWSNGTLAWNFNWTGVNLGWDEGKAVAVNLATHYVYLAGSNATAAGSQTDAFVAQFNYADGACVKNATWSNESQNVALAVAVDQSPLDVNFGNVFLAGYHTPGSVYNAFLAQYSGSLGTSIQNATWGVVGENFGISVAIDTAGNIYLEGTTDGSITGNTDAFVAKYAPNMALQWNQTWGTSANENGYGVAVDGAGNVYLAGNQNLGGGVSPAFLAQLALNAPPRASSPPDITYAYGSTGHTITWTATDAFVQNPTYIISRSGTPVGSGAWTSGAAVVQSVDGLLAGSFTYAIVFSDGLGETGQDTVVIAVTNAPPTLTQPANITFPNGTTGYSVNWTVTDTTVLAPTYAIYQNGTQVTTGQWSSGGLITRSLDGLTMGLYNVTVVASDGLGINGTTYSTVWINVTAAAASGTSPISFDAHGTGVIIGIAAVGGIAAVAFLDYKKKFKFKR